MNKLRSVSDARFHLERALQAFERVAGHYPYTGELLREALHNLETTEEVLCREAGHPGMSSGEVRGEAFLAGLD